MIRDVYLPPPDPNERRRQADISRDKRREKNRANAAKHRKRRAEMTPEELEEARAAGRKRSLAYKKRKRIRLGLPPVGRPGRPKKAG